MHTHITNYTKKHDVTATDPFSRMLRNCLKLSLRGLPFASRATCSSSSNVGATNRSLKPLTIWQDQQLNCQVR